MMETGGLRARPIEVLGGSLAWFEAQLAQRSLRVNGASAFARSVARLRTLRERELAGHSSRYASTDAALDEISDVVGLDFLTKALHWGATSGFAVADQRLQDLLRGEPNVIRPGEPSRERDLAWELVIASLAATFATEVELREPDVACVFDRHRFAVAAKVIYSRKKMRERVIEGFKQAEAQGDAEASLVFVNVARLFPIVDTLRWSRSKNFRTNDEAVDQIKAAAGRWCSTFDLEGWSRDIGRRASRPIGVAFFLPLFIYLAGAPRPFFYSHMPLKWSSESTDLAFVTAFLRACNDVLGFDPNKTGRTENQ